MLENNPTWEASPAEVAGELMKVHFQSGRHVTLNVEGWSMGHTLGPSRQIAVMPVIRPPRLGDVVLLKARNRLIAHRIIRKIPGGQYYITKGDNCTTADTPVAYLDIIGLVMGIKEGGRIRNPWHWTWPFSLFAVLLSRLYNQKFPEAALLLSRIRYLSRRCRQVFLQSSTEDSAP